MAEWSKAPDSSSGLRERAWVQIPLLTNFIFSPHEFVMLEPRPKGRMNLCEARPN
ncbi:unnamed protein product [Linum tenue]|uniref:Uncharacterized protein n=1 Tax=Linum tenue TaxID=586396 RepID=A0AAV0LMW7_9ROSI|nr:unnamed protein product [Linum tenue]